MNVNVPLSCEEIIARLGGSFFEIVKHCLEDTATMLARYVLQLRKEGKMQFFHENPQILYNRLAKEYAQPACKYEAFRKALYRFL